MGGSLTFEPKKEEVSVSFHRLARNKVVDNEKVVVPFTTPEFTGIYSALIAAQAIDIEKDDISRLVRYRLKAPILHVEQFEGRFISGIYKAAYWGHSYDNSKLGKVPADSINLRPFFFMLYLAESGCIYLASQYLGNYGGYTAIKNSVLAALPEGHEVFATSIQHSGGLIANAAAKEVKINYSRKGGSITKPNVFGQTGAIVFKKQAKDDGFEGQVAQQIFAYAQKPAKEIKKALAELLRSNELIEINDEDVEDCKVIAVVNGKTKTIHMLDESSFATRYPVSVELDQDGHPKYEPLKLRVRGLMKTAIIAVAENV